VIEGFWAFFSTLEVVEIGTLGVGWGFVIAWGLGLIVTSWIWMPIILLWPWLRIAFKFAPVTLFTPPMAIATVWFIFLVILCGLAVAENAGLLRSPNTLPQQAVGAIVLLGLWVSFLVTLIFFGTFFYRLEG
jgi:hypothetical protein